jgi:glucokinase-like ROK family protein
VAIQRNIRSGNQTYLRHTNLSAIMRHLRDHDGLSRSDLARITGLNRATITRLVADLTASNFVRESGVAVSGAGRPAIPLEINPGAGYIIGAEVGADFISVILTDFCARVLWRYSAEIEKRPQPTPTVQRLMDALQMALDQTADMDPGPVFGMGVSVSGLIDIQDGSVLFAPNLGWHDVPLLQPLKERFAVPIYVDNVASMSALGESTFGAARNYGTVLYLSTQYGLGGRLILKGNVQTGATGVAGEIGHMTLDSNGRECTCGKSGCWETLASQRAAFERVREAVAAGETTSLLAATGGDLDRLTVELLVEAARKRDKLSLGVLNEVGHYLGVGAANLINALNPHRVVLGGVLSIAREFLMPEMLRAIEAQTLRWSAAGCDIVIAEHGADAALIGGAARVYKQTLENPAHWIASP